MAGHGFNLHVSIKKESRLEKRKPDCRARTGVFCLAASRDGIKCNVLGYHIPDIFSLCGICPFLLAQKGAKTRVLSQPCV